MSSMNYITFQRMRQESCVVLSLHNRLCRDKDRVPVLVPQSPAMQSACLSNSSEPQFPHLPRRTLSTPTNQQLGLPGAGQAVSSWPSPFSSHRSSSFTCPFEMFICTQHKGIHWPHRGTRLIPNHKSIVLLTSVIFNAFLNHKSL